MDVADSKFVTKKKWPTYLNKIFTNIHIKYVTP